MTEKKSTSSSQKRTNRRPQRRNNSPRPRNAQRTPHKSNAMPATKKNDNAVRFIPLGGLEEIGRNMSVFEYKDEIILIDMGLQFPEDDTPGIDYIIPNIESLLPKKDNIKGIIITHGHYDHIGAVPHLTKILGGDIPIYTQPLSKAIIERRQEDYPNTPKLKFITVKDRDRVKISKYFTAEFFETLHTIPDSVSVVLETPVGNIAYSSDLKIDYDIKGNPLGLDVYKDIQKRNIHTLFLESTGAERAGKSVSEELVEKNIEALVMKAEGRLIVGMFASLLTRIKEIVDIAERHGRKVFLSGFSLKTNMQIAQNLGYLKPKKGTILPIEEMHKYKDDRIMVLSTGAQGEPNASMMRIANGEHRFVTIKKSDTIIFSSSVIPGNERPIQVLKDNLTRQGARVYQTEHIDVHSSGHGPADDLKTVTKLIQPKHFIPIHGWYFMRAANVRNAQEVGIPRENCFLVDNGQIVEMDEKGVHPTAHSVPTNYVMVDGLGVGDVEHIVMRDRLALADSGMLVIIATLDRRTGKFVKNPDIISRGFIHLKSNKDIVEDVRKKVRNIVSKIPRVQTVEADYLKTLIREQIGQFIYSKTKRRPMILPVVIEV